MEFDGGELEGLCHSLVQADGCIDYVGALLLHGDGEVGGGEVLLQNVAVDGRECIVAGEAESEDAKVPLESVIDGEVASGLVHAGDILGVGDLLKSQLGAVIPVRVI